MTSSMPAFVRGAKKLMLLKLDGEPGYGIHDEKHYDANGHPIFLVRRVERLSPADRAGVVRGDQLLNVKVLGVDTLAYVWSEAALERLKHFHEICVVEICVKKRDGARISDVQQRHRDHFSQWLTKAKTLSVSTKRFRGAFIASQLRRVVALLYDYEHEYFADRWKELPEPDRVGIVLPLARAFVSETKLPVLVDGWPPRAMASLPTTPIPTPPPSPAPTDADATVSMAGSMSDQGHTEVEDESPRPASPLMVTEPEPSTATTVTHRGRPKLQTIRTASERRRQRAMRASERFEHGDGDPTADVVFIKVERSLAPETPPADAR